MEMNKKPTLEGILNGEPPKTFDVREYVFTQVGEDAKNPNITSKMTKEKKNEFESDFKKYKDCNNLVVKTAIGKKWANTFSYDYDNSYFANLVYKAAFFNSGLIEPLECVEKYEYVTTCDGYYFRGDTMNSWSTTLNEFVRRWGKSYINGWNGRYIPEGYESWEVFFSDPKNYKESFPDYIDEFMKVVYTIGNFIPVPLTPNFNTCRSRLCNDYWDLTLSAIYKYYDQQKNSDGWTNLLSREGVKHWLDGYGSWNAFVERNFLQAFVEDGCGLPKPLWEKHFDGPVLPETKEQFEAFFTNAAHRITERGKMIADALGKTGEQVNGAKEEI